MNALEASVQLQKYNEQINALTMAYERLWDNFDTRSEAIVLQRLLSEVDDLRAELLTKLQAVSL